MKIPHSKKISVCVVLLGLLSPGAKAVTPIDSALAWWSFEDTTSGTNGPDLTPIGSTTQALTPSVPVAYVSVSGVSAANTGGKAVKFDGDTVLKTNDPSLRLGGAQTFWLRVNFSSVAGSIALMDRSRSTNGQRGIALQMSNGRLQAYASEDAQTYQAQLSSGSSYLLHASTWYDIAMVFIPSTSLSIYLYDPTTGSLLDTLQTTTNIPASIVTTNSPGSGYFQVGALNNGSSGSSLVVASGTLIEAAGVWNTALSDADLMSLSAISSVPEPANVAWLAGAIVLMGCMLRRRRMVS
jgi:hypothetical protein